MWASVRVCVNAEERKNMGHRQVFVNAASGITHTRVLRLYSHDMQASMDGIGISVSAPHTHMSVWMEGVWVCVVDDVSCVQILFAFISLFHFCSLAHFPLSLILSTYLPSWDFPLTLNVISNWFFWQTLQTFLHNFRSKTEKFILGIKTIRNNEFHVNFHLTLPTHARTHTRANTLNQNHTHTRRHEENNDSKKYDNWNAYLVMRYARNHIDLPFNRRLQPSHAALKHRYLSSTKYGLQWLLSSASNQDHEISRKFMGMGKDICQYKMQ